MAVKVTVFCGVKLTGYLDMYRYFGGTFYLLHQGVPIYSDYKVTVSSETPVHIYQTTRCYIQEHGHHFKIDSE
jgi:hypothetical protein